MMDMAGVSRDQGMEVHDGSRQQTAWIKVNILLTGARPARVQTHTRVSAHRPLIGSASNWELTRQSSHFLIP